MPTQPSAPEGAFRPVENTKPEKPIPPVKSFAWWKDRLFVRKTIQVIPHVMQDSNANFDLIVSTDGTGRVHIDPKGMERLIDTSRHKLQQVFTDKQHAAGEKFYNDGELEEAPEVQERGKQDWYSKYMIPAIQQVIDSGIFQRVSEFKPATAGEQLREEGLVRAMDALQTVQIPRGFLEKALLYANKDNHAPTIGNVLKTIADTSPKSFVDILAYLMMHGKEGYTSADAIARHVLQVAEKYIASPTENQKPVDKQEDVASPLSTLLDFPLSPTLLRELLTDPQATIPTIGNILQTVTKEGKLRIMQRLDMNKVARIIAWETVNQDYLQRAPQHVDTDEEAWRKVQGNYPIDTQLLEQAKGYQKQRTAR